MNEVPAAVLPILYLHIAGGVVGVVAGHIALFSRKGDRIHRAAGTLFSLGMLVMAAGATIVGAAIGQNGNVFAGIFTIYLLATAWTTVRRPALTTGRSDLPWLAAVLMFALLCALDGWQIASGAAPARTPAGAAGSFIFAAVALIAAAGDAHLILRRGLAGADRVARHLWRMCFALFIAAGSFFIGQQTAMPEAVRGPHLYLLPLLPVGALVFYLVRVRVGRAFKGAAAPG